ncbi:hypothetical protein KVV02_005442 [Mortierella alpina]|uniref:SKP1 component POZ domain-containing protein n=1 Tax=Mortierella alpina TaxID=64518 RepID=A0A9P8A3E4_MORAP|nr:hypothetical protein KVV02_005442 [Mortierella alpina]
MLQDSNEYLTAVVVPTARAMSCIEETTDGSNSGPAFSGTPNLMEQARGSTDGSGIHSSSQGCDTTTKRARSTEDERQRSLNHFDEIKRSYQQQKSKKILREAEEARPVGDREAQILQCLHNAEDETVQIVEFMIVTIESIDGEQIRVSKEIATQSSVIKNMLEDLNESDAAIPLPLPRNILKRVFGYSNEGAAPNDSLIDLVHIVSAADYLDIGPLVSAAGKSVGEWLLGNTAQDILAFFGKLPAQTFYGSWKKRSNEGGLTMFPRKTYQSLYATHQSHQSILIGSCMCTTTLPPSPMSYQPGFTEHTPIQYHSGQLS